MTTISLIFDRLENIVYIEGHSEFNIAVISNVKHNKGDADTFHMLQTFLVTIFSTIDELVSEILRDDFILISVKHQRTLRACFQLITSIGISNCLIPGLGIPLAKRCATATLLPKLTFTDEEKYKLLVQCTDLFTRSFQVPVIKNIIVTLHLSDYLAALIQISFAPLKKPGTYTNFTMTQERYDQLKEDRKRFVMVYEHLVTNCFQPTLMKELLVLQSDSDTPPPAFVKRVIGKELSRRLLAPGGLLSLIRCFIESYDIDTGLEWRKIDMICRIVSATHGTIPENDYLTNISSQLTQILSLNNTHYLATAVACVVSLNERYAQAGLIQNMAKDIFQTFDLDTLKQKANLPGTVILSPQEVNHNINTLHACVSTAELDWPITLLSPNLYVLFLIGSQCTKHEHLLMKLKEILLKCLEKLGKCEVTSLIRKVLVKKDNTTTSSILIEEYDSGIAIKSGSSLDEPHNKQLLFFLSLFNSSKDTSFVKAVFEASLDILINLSIQRRSNLNQELLALEDEPTLYDVDEQYATILQLLSEISMSPRVVTALKDGPTIVMNFIEYFLTKENSKLNEECTTVALVLLNTVLSSSKSDIEKRFANLYPLLKKLSKDESSFNHILCKEALSLLASEIPEQSESAYSKAMADVFDDLLPARAHGIVELTKLVEAKDPETISKKHYVFCLFQEQLKDPDSYIYLSAVNGLAALCTLCTEDVLHILCKQFLQIPDGQIGANAENKLAETRMKIGDVIVKVTKRLGDMAVVHKSVLLNTMLSACRDPDPLLRTSALSNLAEIALVLHYNIGTIIYELLLCIWGIIETDKAVECRRAAVMVITSLLKGLGKETLLQLKENLLPVYRTLRNLYRDENEDPVVRVHAQLALQELNDIVNHWLFPEVTMDKRIFVLDK